MTRSSATAWLTPVCTWWANSCSAPVLLRAFPFQAVLLLAMHTTWRLVAPGRGFAVSWWMSLEQLVKSLRFSVVLNFWLSLRRAMVRILWRLLDAVRGQSSQNWNVSTWILFVTLLCTSAAIDAPFVRRDVRSAAEVPMPARDPTATRWLPRQVRQWIKSA